MHKPADANAARQTRRLYLINSRSISSRADRNFDKNDLIGVGLINIRYVPIEYRPISLDQPFHIRADFAPPPL